MLGKASDFKLPRDAGGLFHSGLPVLDAGHDGYGSSGWNWPPV
jgi:hypothetical protein